jgi:hypothetical protein
VRTRLLVLGALLVVMCGCRTTAPIAQISNAPLGVSPGSKATMADVSRAIWAAGKRLGWVMTEVRPGEIMGTLTVPKHQAMVVIRHDTSTFSIHYRDSVNLRYRDQEIHRRYNHWVHNLARAIQAETAQVKASSQ